MYFFTILLYLYSNIHYIIDLHVIIGNFIT